MLGGLTATLRPVYNTTGPVYAGALPNNAPITLYNTGFQPTGLKIFTGNRHPRSIPSLYPFTAGYVAWARQLHGRRPGPVRHEPPASGDLGAAGRDLGR